MRVKDTVEQLIILRTNDEIDCLIEYLKEKQTGLTAYDTETNSLDADARVMGLCISVDVDIGWYVSRGYWNVEKKEIIWYDNYDKCVELLEVLLTKDLVMHNGTVDVNWTMVNFKVNLMPALYLDTMPAAHLLNENRRVALKELAASEFGEDAKFEQEEMKASVIANGGIWEEKGKKGDKKDKKAPSRKGRTLIKEMYKADENIFGKYGAKDAVLTFNLANLYIARLYEEGLDQFFFDDESMPLFKTATYDLNTRGLKVDLEGMKKLEIEFKQEIQKLEAEVMYEITPYIQDLYPGTKKKNTFNIGASQQMAWLLFVKLDNDWRKLTDSGRDLAKELLGKAPYTPGARRDFEIALKDNLDAKGRPYKLHKYLKCNKDVLKDFEVKYPWCKKLLEYNKLKKLLNTYVIGMQAKAKYGIIHPTFSQTGTTGGRFSSFSPNLQNIPAKDKRIKKYIISRPGMSFVGADQSQIEARVFASVSQDVRLMKSFESGDDFYSIIGMDIFRKYDCLPMKEGNPNAFGVKYKVLREIAKAAALAAAYGTTAYRLSDMLRGEDGKNLPVKRTEQIIRDYFEQYPSVKQMQLDSHNQVMTDGVVYSIYGRPRRLPEATQFRKLYGKNVKHEDLKYEQRSILNLSVNHRIQSSAASIINRAAILFYKLIKEANIPDTYLVLNVHDELIAETPDAYVNDVKEIMQYAMENCCVLPGVSLQAKPIVAKNYADLK